MSQHKLGRHLLQVDADVPADARGRRFCRCGAREDHERHALPEIPGQADVLARYEHDDGAGDTS